MLRVKGQPGRLSEDDSVWLWCPCFSRIRALRMQIDISHEFKASLVYETLSQNQKP